MVIRLDRNECNDAMTKLEDLQGKVQSIQLHIEELQDALKKAWQSDDANAVQNKLDSYADDFDIVVGDVKTISEWLNYADETLTNLEASNAESMQ